MNVAIFKLGSNKIKHYLKDCIREGNTFYGSNSKVQMTRKPGRWDLIWTDDDVNPILDSSEKRVIGWDKDVSELIPSTDIVERTILSREDYREAFKIRLLLDRMTYQDVEDYIENNITDLASAKVFLKRLSKVVLALAKIVDKES